MKSLIRSSKTIIARIYRSRPLTDWPAWVGDLLEVKIPANLTPKSVISPTGGSNINIILHLLNRTKDIPGDIAECGVFKGSSLCAMALYLSGKQLNKQIFGLDSFRGFDESVSRDLQLGG